MGDAVLEHREMKRMQDNIRRSVNSLEECLACQGISECEQWSVNRTAPAWLCKGCWSKVSDLAEKRSEVPASLILV